MPERSGGGRLARPRRTVVGGVVAVVILTATGIGAYAATGPDGTRWRTAPVTTATVQDTLSETATAAPETSVTASYANGGTVTSVAVAVGQTVSAGQVLAQLDTVPLAATLAAAKATTARARLALTQAEDGQLTATSSSRGTSSGTGGAAALSAATGTTTGAAISGTISSRVVLAAAPAPSGAGGTGSGQGGSIAPLQAAITGGQEQVDAALATAHQQLAAAQTACGAGASTSAAPSPTGTSSAAPTSSPSSPAAGPSASPAGPTTGNACLDAEAALLATQTGLATQEASLATALASLDRALVAAEGAAGTTSTGTTRSGSGGTTGTGAGATSTRTSTVPTAAQLAAYQAALDAATAAQTFAQQTFDLATLRSPISGTVLSVGLTAGKASGSAGIVVANPGGFVFDTTVPVASVPMVTAGEAVTIHPDGSSGTVEGTVVRVAVGPDGSGSYPVVIGVDGSPTSVRSGSSASVTITLASTSGGLTVPTSAIQTLGPLKTVRLLRDSKVTTLPVTVVTTGATLSEVRATGLAAGDRVVLADLDAAVPASNSSTTTTRTGVGGTGTRTFGGTTGTFGGGAGATGTR